LAGRANRRIGAARVWTVGTVPDRAGPRHQVRLFLDHQTLDRDQSAEI